MAEAEDPGETAARPARSFAWYWVPLAATLAADLASKAWVFARLAETDAGTWRLASWLRLGWFENTGGAFSLGSGNVFFFVAVTAVLVPAMGVIAYGYRTARLPLWTLGLASGGALGNLYDRLAFGAVRDFIELLNPFGGDRPVWPAFNLADIAIVLGLAAFVVWTWRAEPAK